MKYIIEKMGPVLDVEMVAGSGLDYSIDENHAAS